MDFNDTPEEAKFRETVRKWLAENAPKHEQPHITRFGDRGDVPRAKAWQAAKAAAGYGNITWPKEYGGMGGSPMQRVIFQQEEERYKVPIGVFSIGFGMCIPTIMVHGTPEQKERFIKRALYGEEIWCQLFSEPSAGSDVAGLRTRAERKGDVWVVNGQKVWTSGAHYSDFGILLARTNPDVPKHKGLTMFILDMKSKGVEVRPIKQVTGETGFNEVFFTDVQIPDSMRLGAVDNGWNVALTTLMNERLSISSMVDPTTEVVNILKLARTIEFEDGPAIRNAAVRERLADWYAQFQGIKFTNYRTLTALSRGETPGPENSVGKAITARAGQEMMQFAMDIQDMAGMAKAAPYTMAFLASPGSRIAGGTDEIMKNIIAERVLGLPGDVRVDKDIPFKDMPKGR